VQRYDVAVIGAGLAGLECARGLAEHGLRTLLVDRKPFLAGQVHTTGIFVRRTLEDFALPESCLGPVIRHVVLYSPARRALHLESARDEFRVGKMGALYEQLLARARAAGAVWSPGTRFVGAAAVPGGDGCELDLDGAAARARFVIGADGVASRVATSLGLDVNREWIVGVEDVYRGIALAGPPSLHCVLDPELAPGYLAWVAHDGEEAHVGVGGYADRFHATRALDAFTATVGDIVPIGGATPVERRGGRIPVGGILSRIVCERGLLVGDAAGAVSPLTAGGLDPCMRQSALAVQVARDFLATGDPDALAAYRGDAFAGRFIVRRAMRRAFARATSRRAVELGFGALRLPGLRKLAHHVFFGRGSFPDVGVEPRYSTVAAK
jgi:flavin-dependent dehydrogenase